MVCTFDEKGEVKSVQVEEDKESIKKQDSAVPFSAPGTSSAFNFSKALKGAEKEEKLEPKAEIGLDDGVPCLAEEPAEGIPDDMLDILV